MDTPPRSSSAVGYLVSAVIGLIGLALLAMAVIVGSKTGNVAVILILGGLGAGGIYLSFRFYSRPQADTSVLSSSVAEGIEDPRLRKLVSRLSGVAVVVALLLTAFKFPFYISLLPVFVCWFIVVALKLGVRKGLALTAKNIFKIAALWIGLTLFFVALYHLKE